MSTFVLDLLFAIIFVSFLMMIFKIKEKTFSDNKESYRYIVTGILIMLAVSFLRIIVHQNIFDSVPFLSDLFYFNLIDIIGVLTGLTLIIAGVSLWLPSRKKNLENISERLSLNDSVSQLAKDIIDSKNNNLLFEELPARVVACFNFDSAALFRYNHTLKRLICTDRYNTESKIPTELDYLDTLTELNHHNIELLKTKMGAEYSLSIRLHDTIGAVLIFWSKKNNRLDSEKYSLLDYIGSLLSQKLTACLVRIDSDYVKENEAYLRRLNQIIGKTEGFKKTFRRVHTIFKSALDIEYFSLAIKDKDVENYRIYTSGLNNKILLERGFSSCQGKDYLDMARRSNHSVLINDSSRLENKSADALFDSCNQKSMILVPIMVHNKISGILQLGHSQANKFKRQTVVRAEMMAGALSAFIENKRNSDHLLTRHKYLAALTEFEKQEHSFTEINDLYANAARVISENIGSTLVRITLHENSRLATASLESMRIMPDLNTNDQYFDFDLYPAHAKVFHSRQSLHLKGELLDSGSTEKELRDLMIEGARSVFIEPIIVNSSVIGFITSVEMRDSVRRGFDTAQILFLKEMAAKIATSIKVYRLSRLLIESGLEYKEPVPAFTRSNIGERMKAPIANIRGSLDILKTKKAMSDNFSKRILNNLENDTDMLVNLVSDNSKTPK